MEILVTDEYTTTTYSATVGKGIPILFVDKKNSIGVNGYPDADNQIYVDGTGKATGYIEAKSVKLPHAYSTTEQVVGYWTDGSPIYEKTVELSSALTLASNTWVNMEVYDETIRPLDVIGYNVTSAGYAVVTCLLAQYVFASQRLQFLNARSSGSQITGYTIRYIKTE
jgi:hypothetical protein